MTPAPLSAGLRLVHGNHPETLRDLLLTWMKRYPLAPLEKEVILVQSNGIAQWLKLALAADVKVGDGAESAGGCGIAAALEYAQQRGVSWIFAVATDMPFVRPALIEQLANYRTGVDAVVPLVDGHPQPLAAFYSIDALPAVRALATGEGKRSLRAALERLQVAYVHAADLITADPGLDSFVDLDTPEDLAKAIDQKEG